MRCAVILLCLFYALQVSSFPRHEEEDARVLSEVWDAMERHRGDDIIVVPRRDESGPSDHRSSEEHSREGHSEGPRDHERSHEGPSHHDESSSEPEKPSETESSSDKASESAVSEETSNDTSASESKSDESSSSSSSERSEEPPRGSQRRSRSSSPRGEEGESVPFDKMWGKLSSLGDMMNRAVERLRKDDKEIKELETEQSSSGLTVFILEIVGAVVVGLIVVGFVVFGLFKGVRKIKHWKAGREAERLVDQDAPNMDGTGYQSGYNP